MQHVYDRLQRVTASITAQATAKRRRNAFALIRRYGDLICLLSFLTIGNLSAAEQTSSQYKSSPTTTNIKSNSSPPIKTDEGNDLPKPYPITLPALTAEQGIYTIFDNQLNEHSFSKRPDNTFKALHSAAGKLHRLSSTTHQWITSSGRQYTFKGSVPTYTPTHTGTSRTARHTAHQPAAASTQTIPTTLPAAASDHTQHQTNVTTGANLRECLPSDTTSDAPDSPVDQEQDQNEIQQQTQDEQQCDTDEAGNHTFQPIPYAGAHDTLDARPASCQSYFVEFYGTERGFEIENGLFLHPPYSSMLSTGRVFPVIDFIGEDALYVVTSRDLGNLTFNSSANTDALLDQLLADGEKIQTQFVDVLATEGSITAGELGQHTTISSEELRPITLQLIIRDGMASPAHWAQIEIAQAQLMSLYGITLEVIIIP